MEKIKSVYLFVRKKYRLLVEKKYTTLAGTLVFFLVMAVMPLAVWLTLVFGRLHLPVEDLIEMLKKLWGNWNEWLGKIGDRFSEWIGNTIENIKELMIEL